MQYLELKNHLKQFPIFSTSDIEKVDLSFHKQRLSEWQKKGYVRKIRQGFYMFTDQAVDEKTLFTIANRMYAPSYISLEMALSVYGFIPEAVYGVTSVSSQNTRHIKTDVGDFSYRHIQPHLMFGYEVQAHNNYRYQIAEPEKALLDFLYLHANMCDNESLAGMRFTNSEVCARINEEKFRRYAAAFKSKALEKRAKTFLQFIYHA